jgi:hypothetical protein
MPILVVLTLVPTLSFYFYVLVQFWAEANRRRRHDTCVMIVPLHAVRSAETEYGPRNESDRQPSANGAAGATQTFQPVTVERRSQGPAPANVPPTHLRNRFLTIPSQTRRPAAKRAAKG